MSIDYVHRVLTDVRAKNASQPEFLQAVEEILTSMAPLFVMEPKYEENAVLERLVIPERSIQFRVAWFDDKGRIQVNTGYRIQFNSAIGPYKGGIRFHPSVNLSILKFLGFEQIFKNSLTGLPIGGGKGGSDFDPKGKSDAEVMRFCQAFMTELFRYIGPLVDVPAGDIGVGAREVGYMFGQYKRLTREFSGVFTGKNVKWGGSLARTEATGFGNVYFAQSMLQNIGQSVEGKTAAVSGSGNVATYTVRKLQQLGAKPVSVSDSRGTIYHPSGIDFEVLRQVKGIERAPLSRYAELCKDATFIPVSDYKPGEHPAWSFGTQLAFPCATQNELTLADARNLLKNGCICVSEGANMPSTLDATKAFLQAGICYGPAKCANAGGVATSQLEMEQNSGMTSWTFEEVDAKLKGIMQGIFKAAHDTAEEFGKPGNYVMGGNIAGFRKVADSMIEQGVF